MVDNMVIDTQVHPQFDNQHIDPKGQILVNKYTESFVLSFQLTSSYLQYKRAQYQIMNLLETAKYSEKSSRECFGFVKVSYAKNESRIRIFWSDLLTWLAWDSENTSNLDV